MADNEETDEADEAEDAEEDGESDGDAKASSKGGGGKKKLLMIIGLILLLVIGGLAGAYFTGLLDPVVEMIMGDSEEAEVVEGCEGEGEGEGECVGQKAVFYDLEEVLVNLNAGGRKSRFLKIRISLELEKEKDIPLIKALMPRVIDNFQVYLREIRMDDLKGSAGIYRLREELLRRISAASAPAKIKDVLFKEMLVQ
jgi:flagellar FliL protein